MRLLSIFNLPIIGILMLLHFWAPQNDKPVDTPKIERPGEAWAMRSVLDKKPRMLSIALNKKLYVAYNTQSATIYKAWFGKINFDGSVFNGVHGFQPTSQGQTFLQENEDNLWSIHYQGKTIKPEVAYRGHTILNEQITLKYDLIFEGQKVSIEETPEYFPVNADTAQVGFQRIFKIQSNAANAAVSLSLLSGTLTLDPAESTSLSQIFRIKPDSAPQTILPTDGKTAVLARLEKSDCYSCHNQDLKTVGPSFAEISDRYKNNGEEYVNRLALKVINGGAGNWGSIPMPPHPDLSIRDAALLVNYILSVEPKKKTVASKSVAIKQSPPKTDTVPGDEFPLKFVHPSFTLSQARPDCFKPRVGGMDFLKDGRLVVCTWDSLGSVYVIDGLKSKNQEDFNVKRIATGLAEPLGLKVVDDEIYIVQKQELTKLVDLDHDGVIDEYQTVCNSWKVSDNFHEFAFGLIYKEGYFYATLATDINNGGASTQPQIPDRGKVMKISKENGSLEFIATGLRTPNGIGFGVDHEIFITDNQGDWLPANKIIHLQQGAWYGSRVVDFNGTKSKKETPPAVWLQEGDIANSPSQPVLLDIGPYRNQMIYGDVSYGGLQRVFLEKVNGRYQGAVFRFSEGLEACINRLVWGPDGSLYAGGVGLNWSWGKKGKLRYGLQRLAFNGTSTFEILAVRAQSDGIEIELTEPLKAGSGNKVLDYQIKQWWYKPTENYGGPKMDEEVLTIDKIKISADRRKVVLNLPKMKPGHVVYIRLNRKTIISKNENKLWSTEAWYTMNNIPSKPL